VACRGERAAYGRATRRPRAVQLAWRRVRVQAQGAVRGAGRAQACVQAGAAGHHRRRPRRSRTVAARADVSDRPVRARKKGATRTAARLVAGARRSGPAGMCTSPQPSSSSSATALAARGARAAGAAVGAGCAPSLRTKPGYRASGGTSCSTVVPLGIRCAPSPRQPRPPAGLCGWCALVHTAPVVERGAGSGVVEARATVGGGLRGDTRWGSERTRTGSFTASSSSSSSS
jgi:hypothetical protein